MESGWSRERGEALARVRGARGLRQEDLAEAAGLARSSLCLIERGSRSPSLEALDRISEALGIGAGELLSGGGGGSVVRERPATRSVPLIGSVSAGQSRIAWTDEDLPVGGGDERVDAPSDLRDPHAFALRVRGDSMSPALHDGDVVIISPRLGRVRAGGNALVQMRDGRVYLKAVYRRKDTLILQSVNPAYEPIAIPRSEVRRLMRVAAIRCR